MPSVRYMNQTAPFWDFIAGLESQAAGHNMNSSNEEGGSWGWPFAPDRSAPFHDCHHAEDHPEPGPSSEKRKEGGANGDKDGEQPPKYDEPNPPHCQHGCRGRRPPPPPGPWGPWGRCSGRGGRGGRGHGRGRWAPPPGPWNMGPFGEFIRSQMFGNTDEERTYEFRPDIDVFDTESSFVLHASLPGVKKEDIAVNWDAEKNELIITGVTLRPGDEEFLKTLAMYERKVGAFERKVRLGSPVQPAQIDVDGITAKLEDGILFITVPKLDKDFVEIRKIDVEYLQPGDRAMNVDA